MTPLTEVSPENLPFVANRRLLFIVTGSINAALVPFWLHWLREALPDLRTDAIVTRSAQRFVSIEALRRLVTDQAWADSWDDPRLPDEAHVSIEDAPDCFAVFPSTLDFTMRLANGAGETPAMLALQMTSKPIAIAQAHAGDNPVVGELCDRLLRRTNLEFTPTVPSFSVGRQQWDGETGFYLPGVLATLDSLFSRFPDK